MQGYSQELLLTYTIYTDNLLFSSAVDIKYYFIIQYLGHHPKNCLKNSNNLITLNKDTS